MAVDRNSKEFQEQVRKFKKIKYTVLAIAVLVVVIAVLMEM